MTYQSTSRSRVVSADSAAATGRVSTGGVRAYGMLTFVTTEGDATLLTAGDVRNIAASLNLRPTKARGQNFVIDPNTVRRIVRAAEVTPEDVVLEVGPGLGSLTLGLLPNAQRVVAVEVDEALAKQLPRTVQAYAPALADRFEVIAADAVHLAQVPGPSPTALVANLPYNVAVPVLLNVLERFPSIRRALVMVQSEVADRLAAKPGSRTYGVPSVKATWYGNVTRVGHVSHNVFWPTPNVDSALVALDRHDPPPTRAAREEVFAVVDAAFAQRRKTLRSALAQWAGSAAAAESTLRAAGIDPQARGERLDIAEFAAIAAAHRR
jgi:16S rRNA (adenine1518-N6/adenine1519-N6)-dimethyltransferase